MAEALRVKRSDLFHSSEHPQIHDDLQRALPSALQQCEHRVRRGHRPVNGRRRMPGMPLTELVGTSDVRGPGRLGHAGVTSRMSTTEPQPGG